MNFFEKWNKSTIETKIATFMILISTIFCFVIFFSSFASPNYNKLVESYYKKISNVANKSSKIGKASAKFVGKTAQRMSDISSAAADLLGDDEKEQIDELSGLLDVAGDYAELLGDISDEYPELVENAIELGKEIVNVYPELYNNSVSDRLSVGFYALENGADYNDLAVILSMTSARWYITKLISIPVLICAILNLFICFCLVKVIRAIKGIVKILGFLSFVIIVGLVIFLIYIFIEYDDGKAGVAYFLHFYIFCYYMIIPVLLNYISKFFVKYNSDFKREKKSKKRLSDNSENNS